MFNENDYSIILQVQISAVLAHGHTGQLPWVPTRIGGRMLIYVCFVRHVF